MQKQGIKKISIIGNPCSGKTTLALMLSKKLNIPVVHVDAIQFTEGLVLRDQSETRKILQSEAEKEQWIIEGHGPLKIIEERFQKSDLIIMIRLPLWKNYFWMIKRQLWLLFIRRPEIKGEKTEVGFYQTYKLIQNIKNTEKGLWPQLDRIFLDDKYKSKVLRFGSYKDLQNMFT